ncbi:hypothetical protein AGLY_006322 [Aphis glycines]|uniref:Uncharacterized protein n=1 Tax=Aphis glycines TaxID=307491 RepID=A0A6G0TRL8_APHGL|nr:hypothetical protein AGLY_006322 [Aphis glycines]
MAGARFSRYYYVLMSEGSTPHIRSLSDGLYGYVSAEVLTSYYSYNKSYYWFKTLDKYHALVLMRRNNIVSKADISLNANIVLSHTLGNFLGIIVYIIHKCYFTRLKFVNDVSHELLFFLKNLEIYLFVRPFLTGVVRNKQTIDGSRLGSDCINLFLFIQIVCSSIDFREKIGLFTKLNILWIGPSNNNYLTCFTGSEILLSNNLQYLFRNVLMQVERYENTPKMLFYFFISPFLKHNTTINLFLRTKCKRVKTLSI